MPLLVSQTAWIIMHVCVCMTSVLMVGAYNAKSVMQDCIDVILNAGINKYGRSENAF